MRPRRASRGAALVFLLSVLATACVSPAEATREGGMPCSSTEECNPGGQNCGLIALCVNGFCTATRVIRACADGSVPPEAGRAGDCLSFEDCNAARCGALIDCVNYFCDPSAPRIEVPCVDGGMEGGVDAADTTDEGAIDTGGRDASMD